MYRHQTIENSTALDAEIIGFDENPSTLFQTEMEKASEQMRDLPFYREQIPCYCPPFVCFENQWIGVALTPWMLSVVVLPGPAQQWQKREIGEKINVQLPYKTLTFTASGIEPHIPQYLSCSLLSPLDAQLSAEKAIQLAKDCLTMVLSLPIKQTSFDLNRRNLFGAMLK